MNDHWTDDKPYKTECDGGIWFVVKRECETPACHEPAEIDGFCGDCYSERRAD